MILMCCFWTSQYYFTKLNAFLLFSACDNPTFMRGKLTEVSRGQWHWGTVIVLDFLLDLSTVSDFCVEKTSRMTGTEGMKSCLCHSSCMVLYRNNLWQIFCKLSYIPADSCMEIYNATVVGCAECPECLDCSGLYYCSKAHTYRVTWPWEAMRMVLGWGGWWWRE